MTKPLLYFCTLLLTLATFQACKRPEEIVTPPPPENENLTTLRLIAVNRADSTEVLTAQWQKLNPADTTPPDTSQAYLNLKNNANYNVNVYFIDASTTPADTINKEIQQRSNFHLICIKPDASLLLTVTRLDKDNNATPLELGLVNKFTTGNASNGRVEVTLYHQPNIKNGNCGIGSTDADVYFRVQVR
ncbi:MAG: hypothetical protein EBX41_07670 [Chitinophagia bacterium]|nr:hypothetical protein [Chitinophagia bacterium]